MKTSPSPLATTPASSSPAGTSYFRLIATGIARRDEDDFSQACFELGADGVAEELKFVQKDLRYEPDVVETPHLNVSVYFARTPNEDALLKLEARFPGVGFEMLSEENKDWLAEWKKGFKPFPFAGPFWVIPAWLTPPAEAPADKTSHIYVEPGMAFGTGTHETTRLAAALVIEEVLRAKPARLLDVGTGTGVLALIAYRLGVPVNVGIDIDPEARRTARENLERNQAAAVAIPDLLLDEVTETYDLVIANIIDGILTILRHELVRVLEPGGRLVVSGVLTEREADFYAGFTADTGLRLIKKMSEGEWSAAVLEKKA